MKKDKKSSVVRMRIGKIASIITTILLLACISLLCAVTVSAYKKKPIRIFGYSFHVVVTDSMTPEIEVGNLVVAKKTPREEIKVGDDIVFVSSDPLLKGNMVVHRVVAITENGNFRTSGIKAGAVPDKYSVSEPIGKVVRVSKVGGAILGFLIDYRVVFFSVLLGGIIIIALIEVGSIIFTSLSCKAAKKDVKDEIREQIKKELTEENKEKGTGNDEIHD